MERVLDGRIAIVTGAAGPMGLAAAQALAADGARLALVDLPGARLDAAAQALGGDGAPFACDLAQSEAAAALAQRVTDALGRVDILVNNAGVLSNAKSQATDYTEWRRVLAVNLDAAFLLARAVIPAMKERRWGRIINTSSLASKTGGLTAGTAYSVTIGVRT